jgi:hypothetical protein
MILGACVCEVFMPSFGVQWSLLGGFNGHAGSDGHAFDGQGFIGSCSWAPPVLAHFLSTSCRFDVGGGCRLSRAVTLRDTCILLCCAKELLQRIENVSGRVSKGNRATAGYNDTFEWPVEAFLRRVSSLVSNSFGHLHVKEVCEGRDCEP